MQLTEAKQIVNSTIPEGTIQAHIEEPSRFIFLVTTNDEYEGLMDPWYTVDKNSKRIKGLHIYEEPKFSEYIRRFEDILAGRDRDEP